MKPEQINIAIAKACGFKLQGWSHRQMPYWTDPNGHLSSVPNYCDDLNAMHEAEGGMRSHDRPTYQHQLDKICATSKDPHCSCWDFIHATASQRAEAFLRTLGLWVEDEKGTE
jgi:hypothetical protein